MRRRIERPSGGVLPLPVWLLPVLLLSAQTARADGFSLAPLGVTRIAEATYYELAWQGGPSAFAPAGSGHWGTSLHIRENDGGIFKLLFMLASATTLEGETGRESEYERNRIRANNAQTLENIGNVGSFRNRTEVVIHSDRLGGQVAGIEAREYLWVQGLQLGPVPMLLELGLSGGALWGPVLRPQNEPESIAHVRFSLAAAAHLPVTNFGELYLRFEPNVLAVFGTPNAHSPLAAGARVSPIEQVFFGAEAVWSGLNVSPNGWTLTAGVRL